MAADAYVVGPSGELWVGLEQNLLLTGTYERTLDNKLRLALPKTFREALAAEKHLILTPGTDGSLSLFPGGAFSDLAERLAARSPTERDVRAFSRLLYAQSQSVEVDSQGRIRLAAELARIAHLEDDVILLGVGDRVELWNKSRWEAYLSELQPRYDELAENALSEKAQPQNVVSAGESLGPAPVQPR